MMNAEPLTKLLLARIPYVNCAPFFEGLTLDESWSWEDLSPRQLGLEAEAGRIAAGPMSLVDYLRLQDRFERLGRLGIAVRGRSGSALLFSRKPLRQLDGASIAVTQETSTTALLLRLILEVRYKLAPAAYQSGKSDNADAVLLIGDEALACRASSRSYPFEIDLAFEWWLWQHLPFVFAVWAVRKDCDPHDKQQLTEAVAKTLARNLTRLNRLAQDRAGAIDMTAEDVQRYLGQFVYRFGHEEEQAIQQFERLLHDHRLL